MSTEKSPSKVVFSLFSFEIRQIPRRKVELPQHDTCHGRSKRTVSFKIDSELMIFGSETRKNRPIMPSTLPDIQFRVNRLSNSRILYTNNGGSDIA